MFDGPSNIKITFNSRLKRARLEFLAEECFNSRKPPRSLFTRLEERFKDERNDGFIETFLIFSKRFEELWAYIRSLEGEVEPSRKIKFTIAQGGRIYSEIKIDVLKNLGVATLSCKIAPKRMSSLSFNAFLFNVLLSLDQQGYSMPVDRGQMRFLYLMLKNGQVLENVTLVAQPSEDDVSKSGFIVRINPQLHYATLHVFKSSWLADEASCKKLLKEARLALSAVNVKGIKMNFLEGHSLEKISSLLTKPQAFGFSMPYDLLIAYDQQYRLNANLLANDKDNEHDLHNLKPARAKHRRFRSDSFQYEIEPNAMTATLIGVDERFAALKANVDEAWFVEEFAKVGVVFGFEADLPELVAAARQGENLVGRIVAKGKAAEPGEKLSLHLTAKEPEISDDQLDMREHQNHKIVHSDEMVAEVRYTDGVAGTTVEGVLFFARGSASALGVQVGEGITLKHDCQFFATRDGLLSFEGNLLSCKTAYVHKGSINLASGNLRFEGAVVVEGDIESGATVEINGTLIVKGSIDSAKVRCTGDLEVKGGVNTGKRGYVQVGGSANLGFIENSIVQVGGNLIVQRLITHSWIICGGVVQVNDESKGVIIGGLICAWQAIVTPKFGADKGHTTQCRIGSHYKDEIRSQRLAQRLKRFQDSSEENERSIALLEKPGSRLSDSQKKHYDYIKKNASRYERILARLKEFKTTLDQGIVFNPDATLVVTDIIDKNSLVWISGKKIKVPTNLKGVLLSPLAPKGVLDLSELENFTRHHPLATIGRI